MIEKEIEHTTNDLAKFRVQIGQILNISDSSELEELSDRDREMWERVCSRQATREEFGFYKKEVIRKYQDLYQIKQPPHGDEVFSPVRRYFMELLTDKAFYISEQE